jgi:hypothetical protein
MKYKITEKGVEGQKVGAIVNIKGDVMPAYLIGKARALAEPIQAEKKVDTKNAATPPATAVTNPATGATNQKVKD